MAVFDFPLGKFGVHFDANNFSDFVGRIQCFGIVKFPLEKADKTCRRVSDKSTHESIVDKDVETRRQSPAEGDPPAALARHGASLQ